MASVEPVHPRLWDPASLCSVPGLSLAGCVCSCLKAPPGETASWASHLQAVALPRVLASKVRRVNTNRALIMVAGASQHELHVAYPAPSAHMERCSGVPLCQVCWWLWNAHLVTLPLNPQCPPLLPVTAGGCPCPQLQGPPRPLDMPLAGCHGTSQGGRVLSVGAGGPAPVLGVGLLAAMAETLESDSAAPGCHGQESRLTRLCVHSTSWQTANMQPCSHVYCECSLNRLWERKGALCVRVCVHVPVCMCVHACVPVCACAYAPLCVCLCVPVCACVCVHGCACVCVCV